MQILQQNFQNHSHAAPSARALSHNGHVQIVHGDLQLLQTVVKRQGRSSNLLKSKAASACIASLPPTALRWLGTARLNAEEGQEVIAQGAAGDHR